MVLTAFCVSVGFALQVEHPLNYLFIEGRPCKVHRSNEQYNALVKGEGLIPWNGNHENMIDRFDGRSLLDFYREYDPEMRRPKTGQEGKLEQVSSRGGSLCTGYLWAWH